MTTTIDKFGRVLIPKRLRKQLNLEAGSNVDLTFDLFSRSVILKPIQETTPTVSVDEWGIPSVNFGLSEPMTFDIVTAIKEGREERDQKIMGND